MISDLRKDLGEMIMLELVPETMKEAAALLKFERDDDVQPMRVITSYIGKDEMVFRIVLGQHVVLPRKIREEWPQHCHLCNEDMESADDRAEFHGLGNCVGVCSSCHGSGQATAEQAQKANEMLLAVETAKLAAQKTGLSAAIRKMCSVCLQDNNAVKRGDTWGHVMRPQIDDRTPGKTRVIDTGWHPCPATPIHELLLQVDEKGLLP